VIKEMWAEFDNGSCKEKQEEEQDELNDRKRQFATRMHDKVYKPRMEQTDPEK